MVKCTILQVATIRQLIDVTSNKCDENVGIAGTWNMGELMEENWCAKGTKERKRLIDENMEKESFLIECERVFFTNVCAVNDHKAQRCMQSKKNNAILDASWALECHSVLTGQKWLVEWTKAVNLNEVLRSRSHKAIAPIIEAVSTSETSMNSYETARRNISVNQPSPPWRPEISLQ